jgi:hypothetical protein
MGCPDRKAWSSPYDVAEYLDRARLRSRVGLSQPLCRCSPNRGNIFAKNEEPTNEESMLMWSLTVSSIWSMLRP